MNFKISVLASGSSGNSIYISNSKTRILIDAGLSGKEINRRLNKIGEDASEIDALLVTHEHNDHIKGVGVLSRRYDIPIYANELTWEAAEADLGKIKQKNCKIIKDEFMLGKLGIQPFSISHDASDPVGYILNCGNSKAGVATDMGFIPGRIKERLKGLDCLVIEANHDLEMLMNGSYPWSLKKRIRSEKGHLSNDATAAFLPEAISDNKPRILLGHLSKDNNIPRVAYITIKNNLEKEGLKVGEDLDMEFTFREKPTVKYKIG